MASPNPNAGAGCLNLDIVVQGIDDLATFSQLAELYTKRVLSEMAFYGAYFVLSLIAFQTIFLRRERTGRTWILLSMLSLTFVLVTIYCILDLACLLSQISLIVRLNSLTVTAQTMSEHVAQIQTFYTQKWFRSAQVALTLIGGTADTGLLFVLTDGLSSWRAICIWTSGFRALIGIVPCFFTFCSLVCCIAYTVLVAQLQVLPTLASSNGTPISIFAILASTFSIVANITGTLMIGVTAYKLERLTRKTIGFTSVGTRILVFLTESGILYAMIQIVRLALCTSGTPCTPVAGSLATTFHIFERTTMIASAMYTPCLVLIINTHYTTSNTIDLNSADPESRPADGKQVYKGSNSIVFAPGTSSLADGSSPPRSSVDTSSCSSGEELGSIVDVKYLDHFG